MKFNKKQYMKHYSKCYQKALSILKKLHKGEFVKILRRLLKGGLKNGRNNYKKH